MIQYKDSITNNTYVEGRRSFSFQEQLSNELIQKITHYFTLQDWGRFSGLSKKIHESLDLKSRDYAVQIFPILYRQMEDPRVINLDRLGAGVRLGLPVHGEPNSLESIKQQCILLREARFIAGLSEDRMSIILTIPGGWTMDDLDRLSRAAFIGGIRSATVVYDHGIREVLQSNLVQESKTLIFSNAVIQESCNRLVSDQKELLKAHRLKEEFPDTLSVLTAAVLIHILTFKRFIHPNPNPSFQRLPVEFQYSEQSLYGLRDNIIINTRTEQRTATGWHLIVGSNSTLGIWVSSYRDVERDSIGVGAFRELRPASF